MQLIDKAVELRGSRVLNMRSYHSILWRRRIMALATIFVYIATCLYIVALATSNWAIIEFQNTEYQEVNVKLGVWGEHRQVKIAWKNYTEEWIPHFPSSPDNVRRLAGADLKHYYRVQATIGVIALFLLLSTNALSLYTFYHHRFIFKRLVACLYAVVGMSILVTIEVLLNSIDEWNTAVVDASKHGEFDYDSAMEIGYSTRLAQITVGSCLFAAVAFALGSTKQKGDNAATADLEIEDRPIHIGR